MTWKMNKPISLAALCFLGLTCGFGADSAAAGVTVYAEGAYTANDVEVYIYADVVGDALVSSGVKVTYDPAILTSPIAEKNETVWYMGAGGPDYLYKAPEIASGSVTFLLGKLDSDSPLAGVSGNRVLLGKITLTRNTPDAPTVGLELGRDGSYANFVTVNGEVLDQSQLTFTSPSIHKLGDADANGYVDFMDMLYINSSMIPVDGFTHYADGDRNGYVDFMDMLWIKDHMD